MDNVFDPIEFLGLVDLPAAEKDEIRKVVTQDMGKYLVMRVLDKLPDDLFDKVEALIKTLKTPQEAYELIYSLDPEFETNKIKYLVDYKKEFDLSKIYER